MVRFLIQRFLSLLLVLFGVSVLVFLMVQLVPGDPARAILGMSATAEKVAEIRNQLGLDKPLIVQYFSWINGIVHGNLGRSYSLSQPVASILFPKLQNTIILTVGSLIFCILVGVILGILAGTKQYSFLDRISMFVSLIGASIPVYWLGLILVAIFALNLHWLPVGGIHDVRNPGGFGDLLIHLILPAIAASTVSMAVIARLSRSTIIEVLQQDFVKTLRANGIPESRVIWRHALRNVLPPIVNITGLQVGYLLGGVLFIEVVFNWPGLGQQLYTAITGRDMPVIQAGVLFIALAFVVINLVTDLIVALLDPRIRRA
jgi:peptide/nickel transport system permease protein